MRQFVLLIFGAFSLCLFWTASGWSYDGKQAGKDMSSKLLRGMTNAATGWMEVPKQVYLRGAEGPHILGIAQGMIEGLGMSLVRTTAGLYEFVTFPLPLPWRFKPLFYPEYIWENYDPEQWPGADKILREENPF